MRRALAVLALSALSWAAPAQEPPPAGEEVGPEPPPAGATPDQPAPPASDADAVGFGAPVVAAPPPPPPQDWSVYGSARSDWAVSPLLNGDKFAKARQSLDLNVRFKKGIFRLVLGGHAEYDFAYLYLRDVTDQPTRDAYEWQLFPREAYAALSLGAFDLSAGYQVVPWGHGDLVSALDVAMPRDQREPGLQDAGDLRLPVLSSRLSWFRGAHRLEFMMIHLPAYGLRTPPNGPFSPLPALFDTSTATAAGLSPALLIGRSYDDSTPSFNQQFLLRYAYSGPRVDLGVYAATLSDQRGVFVVSSEEAFLKSTTLSLYHDRYAVLGTSGSAPLRWFLLTWELGTNLALPLNTGQFSTGTISSVRAYLVNTELGLSYTGVQHLRLTLEVLKPWVLNQRSDWLQQPDRPVFAARASYTLFRERLQLSATASFIGFHLEQGWFLRGEGSFTIRDGLKISAGYITYHQGSEFGGFYGLDTHDRVYAGLRWDFTLL